MLAEINNAALFLFLLPTLKFSPPNEIVWQKHFIL